ncbi:hypothetical protein HNY73_013787 [Argiope bruennichi]|uniref:Uncharacterized protein n=1 Tax=Argiope bruennichi TaxID=94029 RepID=A0A8T0ENI7_ARGBR|nr:hypothetical protein HNY73_013787 [Argiope bruennichi]
MEAGAMWSSPSGRSRGLICDAKRHAMGLISTMPRPTDPRWSDRDNGVRRNECHRITGKYERRLLDLGF